MRNFMHAAQAVAFQKPFITRVLIDWLNHRQWFVRARHKSVFLYTRGFGTHVAFRSTNNGACQFSAVIKAAKTHGSYPGGEEQPSLI